MLENMPQDKGQPGMVGGQGLEHVVGAPAPMLKPWSQWLMGDNCCGNYEDCTGKWIPVCILLPCKVVYNCLTSSLWWVEGWGGGLSGVSGLQA